MSKRDVLLAIHNLSEMKRLTNYAKIRSSLKISTYTVVSFPFCSSPTTQFTKTVKGQEAHGSHRSPEKTVQVNKHMIIIMFSSLELNGSSFEQT